MGSKNSKENVDDFNMLFRLWVFPEIIVSVLALLAHNYVPSSVMCIVKQSAYVRVMTFNMQYIQLNELLQPDRFRQIDCARNHTNMQQGNCGGGVI